MALDRTVLTRLHSVLIHIHDPHCHVTCQDESLVKPITSNWTTSAQIMTLFASGASENRCRCPCSSFGTPKAHMSLSTVLKYLQMCDCFVSDFLNNPFTSAVEVFKVYFLHFSVSAILNVSLSQHSTDVQLQRYASVKSEQIHSPRRRYPGRILSSLCSISDIRNVRLSS